jgi:aldehyde:ferredoxin oxidoreductase
MKGGYCGTILEVDLTTGTIIKASLPPEDILRKYIGGAGLGLYMLAQRIRPGMELTDPDAPMILMTGPLTGTKAPSSSDWTIVALHGTVPHAPAVSHAHGHFGARLKHAGYDGIVVQGASPRPVYLWIDDATVELRDAESYWGKDTFETPQAIGSHHGDADNISVACIGPAGEELLRGASVRSEGRYGASKGSTGVTWGAKKLKAIAVRGTGTVPLHDADAFLDVCQKWRDAAVGAHGEADIRRIGALAKFGAIPWKNYTDGGFQAEYASRYNEDVKSWKITPIGSWECDYKCHSDTLITTGPFAGTRVVGYISEVIEDGATIIGVEDPGTGVAMANFYDAMGCDPAESGRLIAMAFELYNNGELTKEETGGLDLTWGNDEAARELFMQILYRQEPLGNILAKGYKEATKILGKGTFVHTRGAGFNSHDLRGWGIGRLFDMMVSGAGPTWQGVGVEHDPEPDLGYTKVMDRGTPEGKAEACYKTGIKKLWEDSIGVCWFACTHIKGVSDMAPKAVSLATGWDFSWQEALAVGDRLIQLMRLIAVSRGFKKQDDLDASERILTGPVAGPAAGRSLKPHLSKMVDDYYELAGWDLSTGVPSAERLNRLGLTEMLPVLNITL